MLILRNYLSYLKHKLPILKIHSIYLSSSSKGSDGKKVDNPKKNEIQFGNYDFLESDESEYSSDSIDFTSVENVPVIEDSYKPVKSRKQLLTPWTIPNLLQPFDLNNLPSRNSNSKESKTFASMLRHSTLIQMGDFQDLRVIGVVIEVVDKDLYIDYGGKFYCVVTLKNDLESYYRGQLVKLIIKDMEITSAFMLDKVETTVLEAEGVLIGPLGKIAENDFNCLWNT